MIDNRSHYALMVAEDRIRDLHREADVRRRLEGVRRQAAPRREGRRHWSIADAVNRLVLKREVKLRKTATSPEPL